MFINRFSTIGHSIPQPIMACVWGAVVAAILYLVMKYVWVFKEDRALAQAILAGLLVAEVLTFTHDKKLPSMSAITLWLYFYYNSVENH